MEILLPSTGSMAMAGLKGRFARTFSSSGVRMTGSGVSPRCSGFGFGGGASSGASAGGSSCAGRGATVLIVATPARLLARRRAGVARDQERRDAGSARKATSSLGELRRPGHRHGSALRLVPGTGIEPASSNEDRLLRPARLPIPPPGHRGTAIVGGKRRNVNCASRNSVRQLPSPANGYPHVTENRPMPRPPRPRASNLPPFPAGKRRRPRSGISRTR